jgi:hypothetical protein
MEWGNYPGRVFHWPAAANPGNGRLQTALGNGLPGQANNTVQQAPGIFGRGWLNQVGIAAADLINYSRRQFGPADVYPQRQIIIF